MVSAVTAPQNSPWDCGHDLLSWTSVGISWPHLHWPASSSGKLYLTSSLVSSYLPGCSSTSYRICPLCCSLEGSCVFSTVPSLTFFSLPTPSPQPGNLASDLNVSLVLLSPKASLPQTSDAALLPRLDTSPCPSHGNRSQTFAFCWGFLGEWFDQGPHLRL